MDPQTVVVDGVVLGDLRSVAPGVEVLPRLAPRGGGLTGIGPRHVHVVDATPSLRHITATLLGVSGFTVESFDSPYAALDASRRRRPDVLVIEPRTPGSDALAAMRAWRAAHPETSPPVVWCTSVTPDPTLLSAAADLGLRGVVVKPFRLEALGALVVRVCRAAERERRLLLHGVRSADLREVLSPEVTRLWARVEVELADDHARPLSLVTVGSSAMEVVTAVRLVVRAVDVLGRAGERTLLVMLPDVDAAGAAVVARRVDAAVAHLTPAPDVRPLTREPGEDALDLLARAVATTVLGAAQQPGGGAGVPE